METVAEPRKPIIAVAGASGFVGSHLRNYLKSDYRFRALTRSTSVAEQSPDASSTEWRECDLYSLPKVTKALLSCDCGIYLVHSMAPSSRLVQGSFEDTDLLLADNFIRAAEAAGLKHVVYLSGLMPNTRESLSPHLRSRLEVENVLRSRSIKVTVLRAGLIFGPGGVLVFITDQLGSPTACHVTAGLGALKDSINRYRECLPSFHALLARD